MRIALIGQPNCGKSTLFNQVAGYKAETGNFSGTTVSFTESKVRVAGQVLDLVDLPGTYTLEGTNPAEAEAQRYLGSSNVDVIINVVDGTHLSQGLELTLELLELKRPLVVAVNMMDDAVRMGLKINGEGLQDCFGVPVLPLVAKKGRGVKPLFTTALELAGSHVSIPADNGSASSALERHLKADELVKTYVQQQERTVSFREKLDDVLLHPFWGYVALIVILYLFFQGVFQVGSFIEQPLLAVFDNLDRLMLNAVGAKTLLAQLLSGLIQGISGGLAIALPYLVPFMIGLGFLEDIGYLPRIAFLMDGLMHRIGLHGKSIVPFILGFGCNIPAVMSTRILEEKKDRFISAALAVLVPCAARLSVIFGLVAFYLGPLWALAIYLLNILVIAVLGRVLSWLIPEDTPGLILEMPTYRMPTLKTVWAKTWFRVKEFIVEGFPLLIAGSVVLALLIFYNLSPILNTLARPFTWVLGLPAQTGVPLIFGVLRKELSLIMLRQAMGVANFSQALTRLQMLTYTVFIVFYIPCLSTLAVLRREFNNRDMLKIVGITLTVATITAVIVRAVGSLFLA
jgi:small GTP-binding protein